MFLIVMGVSGSGKTTIGRLLSERLGIAFYDADDFHPPANVAKMAAGIPLTDEDRSGWLAALAAVIRKGLASDESGIIACSALKESYRSVLRVVPDQVKFIYLRGGYALILSRMQARNDHYMKPGMLQSQFSALEEPEGILTVDISLAPDVIVDLIVDQLWKENMP